MSLAEIAVFLSPLVLVAFGVFAHSRVARWLAILTGIAFCTGLAIYVMTLGDSDPMAHPMVGVVLFYHVIGPVVAILAVLIEGFHRWRNRGD